MNLYGYCVQRLLGGAEKQQYHIWLICLGNQNNLISNLISQEMKAIMKMKVPVIVAETSLLTADPHVWDSFLVHSFCLYSYRPRGHGWCSSQLMHWNASETLVIIRVFSPLSSLINKVHLIWCNCVAHWLAKSQEHAYIADLLNRKYVDHVHSRFRGTVQESLELVQVLQWNKDSYF